MIKFAQYKTIIFDFDGVLTNNLVQMDENGKESIVIGRKKVCFHRHSENSRPERDKSIESALIAFSSAVHTMTWTSHRTPF